MSRETFKVNQPPNAETRIRQFLEAAVKWFLVSAS